MKYKDVLEWKENLSLLGIIIIVPLGLIFKTIWVVADAVWDSFRFCTKGCIWVKFNPKLLTNGIYNLSLKINKDENLVYDKNNIYSFSFNNENYNRK